MGNSLYASQGAIPKASPRKRNEISSRFGRKIASEAAHKHDQEHSFQKKATDMIESWTWGNQPGMSHANRFNNLNLIILRKIRFLIFVQFVLAGESELKECLGLLIEEQMENCGDVLSTTLYSSRIR